jgi:hypothetical protein
MWIWYESVDGIQLAQNKDWCICGYGMSVWMEFNWIRTKTGAYVDTV